ncbi:MAG TPA: protein kinase [Acidobacteriota bacterium]|nr:protein kinase [Acidobacteriota bacterium]HPB27024.1 protein kinase [Acidobacteriota bacterium]HQP74335.1 protein kinase [Acidobacteriota bacterium]
MIGQTVGHYHIVEELGAGGMGVVYRAEDTRLRRAVALKFLPPELSRDEAAKRRFLHEAQAAAALDHPNICNIHEVAETADGQIYIAMACYAGETLRERIAKGPLPLEEALQIAREAAAGLAHAHARGIVHRDVKPANLFLTADGLVKVLDFGLAKLAAGSAVTKTGTTLGTAGYMSPEQARGESTDARTDVWSLGVVLYEMVAGRPPFAGEYPQAVMYGILNEAPEPLTGLRTGVPIQLDGIIGKALAKDPSDRYQTLADLAVDLRGVARVVAGGPVTPSPVTGPTPVAQATAVPMRRPLWKRWPAGVAAVLLLAAIGAGIYLWAPWRPTEKPWRPVRLKLAVLPFENLGSPDKEYVADGVTEEITGRLAEVYGLAVVARTSVLKYKKSAATVPQIAEELGVDYLLEGSVRWQGGAAGAEVIRVTAQLIRAVDGTHLWNEQYDETAADLLGKQSLIAEKVGAAMVVKLVDGEWQGFRDKSGQPVYTRNTAAYDSYMKGDEKMEKTTALNLDEALKFYEKATAMDPGFWNAFAGQYIVHDSIQYFFGDRSERRAALAWGALQKWGELEPDNPYYHMALGAWYARFKGDCQLAEKETLLAERGRPGEPAILHNLGTWAVGQGKFNEGLRYMARLVELRPTDWYAHNMLTLNYVRCQRYADAERTLKRAMAVDQESKNTEVPYMQMAWIYVRRDGDPAKAVRYLDSLPPTLRRKAQKRYFYVRYLYWTARYERFLEHVRTLEDIIDETSFEFEIPLKAVWVGRGLDGMGRKEEARAAYAEALRQLEKLEQERRGKGQEARLLGTRREIMRGLGRKEEAIRLAREVVEMVPLERDAENHLQSVYDLAVIFARFGENDLALDQLEYYFSHPAPFENINMIKLQPEFKALLPHPRFKALEKKYPPDKPYEGE